MEFLEYFLFGVGFCLIILSFIDGIMTLFQQILELICTKIAVKTYQEKLKIDEKEELEPCIGFHYTPEESCDEEEEENKVSFGFKGGAKK